MTTNLNHVSEELKCLVDTSIEAGNFLKRELHKTHSFETKRDGSWVSEMDVKSDKLIYNKLKDFFSLYSIISEESGGKIKPKSIWVDPLDGTTNYKIGFPYFCVSIGIVENNESTKGVIFNPMTNELFYAEKGKGAFLESDGKIKKLSVSDITSLEKGNIALERYHKGNLAKEVRELYKEIQASASYTRELGSCALDMCHVASGMFDAAVFSNNGHGYDVAAGCVILEEAGGEVTNFSKGNVFQGLTEPHDVLKGAICSNGKIHGQLESLINKNFPYYDK